MRSVRWFSPLKTYILIIMSNNTTAALSLAAQYKLTNNRPCERRSYSSTNANRRSDQHIFTSNDILETGKRFASAQKEKSNQLPEVLVEAYVAESKAKCWTKALLLQYLREHCGIVVPESTRVKPKDDDDEGYKSLQQLVVEHWQEHQFHAEELTILLEFVKANKALPPIVAIGQPMEDVSTQATNDV